MNDLRTRSGSPLAPARGKAVSSARAVGAFVPRLTKKAVEKYGFSAAALITDWSVIVGVDIARYSQPQRLKWPRQVEAWGETEADAAGRPGATLVLRVDAARALDIQYQARQIIDRINAYFGYRAVAALRLIQAPVEPAGKTEKPRQVVARKTLNPALHADLSHIEDDRLKAALQRLQGGIRRP